MSVFISSLASVPSALFSVDYLIFIGFLLLNLSVGLYYGRNVKTIRDFAVGRIETFLPWY